MGVIPSAAYIIPSGLAPKRSKEAAALVLKTDRAQHADLIG